MKVDVICGKYKITSRFFILMSCSKVSVAFIFCRVSPYFVVQMDCTSGVVNFLLLLLFVFIFFGRGGFGKFHLLECLKLLLGPFTVCLFHTQCIES